MTTATINKKITELKQELQLKFFVSKIGYFGSYANNTQREDSDLDVLVEFSKPVGWEFFDLKDFLEKELQVKVDLVTPNALKSQLKDKILSQVHYVS
jgi:predicted nucleotidyltransferase